MNKYDYAKAYLIRSYSDLKYMMENYNPEELFWDIADKSVYTLFRAVDAMCEILILESDCDYNNYCRLSVDDEQYGSSAELFACRYSGYPEYVRDGIFCFHTFEKSVRLDIIEDYDELRTLFELYDKLCTWFWSVTDIREELTKDDIDFITNTICLTIPIIDKNENDPYLELLVSSIKNSKGKEQDVIPEQDLLEEIGRLSKQIAELSAGIDVIDKKIDSIAQDIRHIASVVESAQSMICRQLNEADDESEREILMKQFASEVVDRIEADFSKNNALQEYEDESMILEKNFGDAWKKMDQNSQRFIASAKVMYKNQVRLGDMVDYSGVCVLITKALELELDKRFYEMFLKFMRNKYPGKDNHCKYPTSLLNKHGHPCRQKEYTIGSVPYTLCYLCKGLTEEQVKNNKKVLVEFAASELMPNASDEEILDTLQGFGEKIEMIRKDYRNPCAHTNALREIQAKECMDMIVDVEKFLKTMLDTFVN